MFQYYDLKLGKSKGNSTKNIIKPEGNERNREKEQYSNERKVESFIGMR